MPPAYYYLPQINIPFANSGPTGSVLRSWLRPRVFSWKFTTLKIAEIHNQTCAVNIHFLQCRDQNLKPCRRFFKTTRNAFLMVSKRVHGWVIKRCCSQTVSSCPRLQIQYPTGRLHSAPSTADQDNPLRTNLFCTSSSSLLFSFSICSTPGSQHTCMALRTVWAFLVKSRKSRSTCANLRLSCVEWMMQGWVLPWRW